MSGSKEEDESFLTFSGQMIDELKNDLQEISIENLQSYCFKDFKDKLLKLGNRMADFSSICFSQLHIKLSVIWLQGDLYGLLRIIKDTENPWKSMLPESLKKNKSFRRRKLNYYCRNFNDDLSEILKKFHDIDEHFKELDKVITNHGRRQENNPKDNETLEILRTSNAELILYNWIFSLYCYLRRMLKHKLPKKCMKERHWSDSRTLKITVNSNKKNPLIRKALGKFKLKYSDYINLKWIYRGLVKRSSSIIHQSIEDRYEIKPNFNSLSNFSTVQLMILERLAEFDYQISDSFIMDKWKDKMIIRNIYIKRN